MTRSTAVFLALLALRAALASATTPSRPAEAPSAHAVPADDDPALGDDDATGDASSSPVTAPAGAAAVHAPPPLPSDESPLGLLAALPAADRATLERDMKVVTFDERITRDGDRTKLEAVSLGVSPQSPDAIRSVLAAAGDYPSWLTLHPSYKAARTLGSSRLVVEVGSADAPKAKRTMTYSVQATEHGARWTVVDSGTQLEPGSQLEYEVVPHPSLPGASLVVHRQVGTFSEGRMLKYLASDDKNGKNRWWKDANRHARRLQGALEAAASEPPGRERERAYIARFQREFGGNVPYWAK